jgi:WD40 repeat protein
MVYGRHTNGTIGFWSAATLQKIADYPLPEEQRTNSVAWELSPAGKLAWSTKEAEIVVWDLPTRRRLARFPWVPGEGKRVAFSHDDRYLAAGARGRVITVWDLEKLKAIATLPKSEGVITVLSFSPDLHMMAAGEFDGTIEVWDLTRKERVAEWQAHMATVAGINFTADGKRLATVSEDATAKLWDLETRRQTRTFRRTLNSFYSLAISPNGQRITAGASDGLIHVWSSTTGLELATLRTRSEGRIPGMTDVKGLQFLPTDENTLVSICESDVRVWHAPSWEEIANAEARETARGQLR